MATPDRSTPPQVRPFGHLTLPAEESSVLSNGLKFHTLSSGDQDVARLSIFIEGGSADCANPCIAAFAAELLREGNRRLDSEQMADLIDYNGAWLTSSASVHHTGLRVSALSSRLGAILPAVVDSIIEPSFPRQAFKLIRRKGASQQQLNLSRVSFLANADNKRLICGADHPDSRTPSPEDIEAIAIGQIEDFHRSRLDAGRIHAYLCGRLTPELTGSVARILETIPRRGIASPITIVPYTAAAPTTSVVDKPGALQSAVALSLPAIARSHPDYNALRMTVTALGGYFGSRLMSNIREDKGYTYGISSALLGSLDGSYITISAQCDTRYTEALIDEVRNELHGMADRPLDAAELQRLRFNVASDLASTLDSPMTMMDYYELNLTVGTPADYFEARQKALATLDADVVCEMARKYLQPDALRISIAGDMQ